MYDEKDLRDKTANAFTCGQLASIALFVFVILLMKWVAMKATKDYYENKVKPTEAVTYSKPEPYKPSPKVQAKIDSALLMIKYMGTRDSFYFASLTAYVRESDRLGNRLKDSADKYSKLIQSFK